MPRAVLVAVLVFTLLLSGCTVRQTREPSLARDPAGAVEGQYYKYHDWLDNHPFVRGVVYSTAIILGCIALGAAAGYAITHQSD